jgi:hypothetical protein
MHALKIGTLAILLACAALLAPARSEACGGCFGPPATTSTVTGHRMAFAVSAERTVLWDQFEYSGAPEDFSWVLPVLPGAYLEASTDAWFESLEAVTRTQISAPPISCAQPDSSGCGVMGASDSAASEGRGFYGGGGVMVLHRGTVGPYDTVTLRSQEGDALTQWLTDNGYVIPPDIEPVIEAYVSEGADFIAVRLSPDKGVQQMTPVRVVTPGGEYLLPLRMVAAGVGLSVNIVLYVIGEHRYGLPDLHEVSVDTRHLSWKFSDNTTNYPELRRDALADFLGFTYLPSFAFKGAFSRNLPGPSGGSAIYNVDSGFNAFSTFTDLYFGQALSNDALPTAQCLNIASRLQASSLVVEAEAPADAPSGSIASGTLTCQGYTDISAAMIGMHPSEVWITRLELDLPREALSMDCVVVPADSQEEVSNQLQAVKASDRPAGCDEVLFESRVAPAVPSRAGMLVFLSAVAGLLLLRRRGVT